MFSNLPGSRLWLLMLLIITCTNMACAAGARLQGQAKELEAYNERLHPNESPNARAYRCAPKEMALARAHHEFGVYELGRGNFSKARKHLQLAEDNARRADQLSQYDACRVQDSNIDVVVVEAEQLRDAPSTFLWDSDGDGVPDHLDECPLEPQVFLGFGQHNGCPNYDVDDDGVPNTRDHCPFIPANIDGFPGENGCPNLDIDGDGVLNINDQCPEVPTEFIGYEDDTGCPNMDVDGDGILNVVDQCPFEAGPADNNGCPRLAEITADQIKLNQRVHFAFDKAEILPQSYPLLNDVAQILLDNPHIEVRIEGHTDSRGNPAYNQRLSQERAQAVKDYLSQKSIDASRMDAVGYGQNRPIDDNSTDEGRAANRRVEIHITHQ